MESTLLNKDFFMVIVTIVFIVVCSEEAEVAADCMLIYKLDLLK